MGPGADKLRRRGRLKLGRKLRAAVEKVNGTAIQTEGKHSKTKPL